MRIQIVSTLLSLVIAVPTSTTAAPQSSRNKEKAKIATASCPVTLPRKAPEEAKNMWASSAADWNGALYVGGLWPNGTIVFRPGGVGFILPDGSLAMKFGWLRGPGLRGKLIIHGRRLDTSGPPLRADIPAGYADTGFQATELIFPSVGCWKVTGEVGSTKVTFVTRVVKSEALKQ
jgi:hypothetical protein